METLIRLGSDVEAKDLSGNTPLHEAAECGHQTICQILLNQGTHYILLDDGSSY